MDRDHLLEHFIALLFTALVERQIRTARLPAYPEFRGCAASSTDTIFEIFAHVQRHELYDHADALPAGTSQTPRKLKIEVRNVRYVQSGQE